ncbi:MAG: hypothetical protein IKJ30_06335 [Bacilli bacterium]|nr:hypothetical protein [Bacilli bacterium]
MKKKILTCLLAIFMMIPIVGCGDPDLSRNPEGNEVKVLLDFAEVSEDGNSYITKQVDLQHSYGDCATLTGAGFYKSGESAPLNITFNHRACSFKGWIKVEGELVTVVSDKDGFNYVTQSKEAGQTVRIYAVMALSGDAGRIETTKVKYQLEAIYERKFVGESPKLVPIDDEELINYKFPGTSATPLSFNALKTKMENDTESEQGGKFGDIAPESNLSYYMNSSGELQYHKISWTFGVGKCATYGGTAEATTPFDPATTVLPASPYICVRAEINLVESITNSFIKDAVSTTFYSQAYIDTVNNSSCMSATVANVNVSATCMYAKNIGALTRVTPGTSRIEDKQTLYHSLSKDSFGGDRVEAVQQESGSVLSYKTAAVLGDNTNVYRTAYSLSDLDYMSKFHMNIEPVYRALITALNNPGSMAGKLEFTYNEFTNSSAVKSIVVGATTYYFNYVDHSPASPQYGYSPEIVPGSGHQQYNLTTREDIIQTTLHEFELKADNPVIVDTAVQARLLELISSNPQNMMLPVAMSSSEKRNHIKELIYELVNSVTELKHFRKYENVIEISGNKINVKSEDKSFNFNDFDDFDFIYDDSDELKLMYYDDNTNPTKFDDDAYGGGIRDLLELLNIVISDDEIADFGLWIKFTTEDDFIEVTIYEPNGNLVRCFRYYNENPANPRFDVINVYNNMPTDVVELSVGMKNKDNLESFGDIVTINGPRYTLTTSSIYSIEYSDVRNINTYTVIIEGQDYIIDITHRKVYYISANRYYDLKLNLADDLKYYFELEDEEYYGIYLETEGNPPVNKFVIYKVELPTDLEHTKGDLVGEMTKVDYLGLDGGYYLIEKEDTEYTLHIPGTTPETFILDDTTNTSVQITIEEVIVKDGTKVIHDYSDLDIYKLYIYLNGKLTEIQSVLNDITGSYKSVIVDEGAIRELIDLQGSPEYEFRYEGIDYNIAFSG